MQSQMTQDVEVALTQIPDRDLRSRVLLFLAQRGHQPLTKLEVEAHEGVVTLRGRLPSFYQRQLALACASHVAGVIRVVDLIETLLLSNIPAIPKETKSPG